MWGKKICKEEREKNNIFLIHVLYGTLLKRAY